VSTVVHVTPHPDDEALGAPATLLLLRRAGWTVINLLDGLGRREDEARRRDEALDAGTRAGFQVVLPDGRDLATRITSLVADHSPELFVSPWPHDRHPTHERVARATGAALAALPSPPVWWQWGLWADLGHPTLYVPFDHDVLTEAHGALAAYAGELARNDYARLLAARATAHAVLGSERVFGFGRASASPLPYAELLVEQRFVDGEWRAGPARVLDVERPLSP
jgi:LmbE family N-acetylglucosaminyl deacetylase